MWQGEGNSDSEPDADDVEETDTFFKPTFVVIAIDTHPVMFRKTEDGSTPFKDSLSACYTLADSLLLTTNKRSWNQFAVLVAREESPSLTDFRDNLIDTVKLLKEKSASPDKQLAEEFQRKGEFDLASFLLECKKVFHDIKSPFYKRTLIYITDDDEPVQDGTKKFTAFNEIKTFSGNQIDFQVITTTADFNYSKFYNELFSLLDNPPLEEICEDREGLIEKLTSAVVMRHTQRKILFYPFKGDTARFLNYYKLDFIRPTTLYNTKLTRDGKSVKLTAASDEFVDKTYRFRSKEPGRDTITFSSDEYNSVMDSTLPLGLTLLYISKRSTDVGYVLGKPFLLQPKEKENTYFKNFWQSCVNKERVLVCALKQKQPGKIRYTELIPIVVNNSQTFLVKTIPFANEVVLPKKADYPEPESNEQKKEAICQMVQALTFDFDVKMIPDPCYKKKKEYVKAKLLDEPMAEVKAETLDNDVVDEHLKEAVDAINKNFTLAEAKKRKAPAKRATPKRFK